MRERMKALMAEYGKVALGVYLTLYALTLAAIVVMLSLGLEVKGAAGTAGVLGGAWVASRLTLPLRLAATAVLTPQVSRVIGRVRAKRSPQILP